MTDDSSKELSGTTSVPGWNEFVAAVKGGAGGAPASNFLASIEAVAEEVAERREQVGALIAQLAVFEQQLAALKRSLQPSLAWSRAWVRMTEQALDPFGLMHRDEQS